MKGINLISKSVNKRRKEINEPKNEENVIYKPGKKMAAGNTPEDERLTGSFTC